MNFGIDIRHLTQPNPSGIGRYTINIINALAEASPDDTFTLFATGTAKTLRQLPAFSHANVRVVSVKIPNKIFKTLMLLPFGPSMESFLPERIDAWFFPDSNIIKTELPYAITAHDLSYKIFPEFFTSNRRRRHALAKTHKLFKNARAIVAVSEATKTDLIELEQIAPNAISVAPLAAGSAFHPKRTPQDATFLRPYNIRFPYFLTLSTLEPRKNIESVIEAYDAWRTKLKRDDAPALVIAGGKGWKTTGIEKAINAATYRQSIHCVGYINEVHKPALYRNATALLFPSFYEGFGLPALEAMACGTPVITTFTGSLPEVVGDAGILIDPYNVRDLEQAFSLIGSNDAASLRAELSQRSLARASKFSWKNTAKTTLQVLHSLA